MCILLTLYRCGCGVMIILRVCSEKRIDIDAGCAKTKDEYV